MLIAGKFKEAGIVPNFAIYLPNEVCEGVENAISQVRDLNSLITLLTTLDQMNIHFVGSRNRVFPSNYFVSMISTGNACRQYNLLTRTLGLRQKFIELHQGGF